MDSCIVVTGGGSGIGRAVAEQLAVTSDVVIVGRRFEKLEVVAADLGERVVAVQADLTRPEGARSLADSIAERELAVGALVTCAGGASPATPASLSLDEYAARWRESDQIPLLSSVLTVEALRDSLMANAGRVAFIHRRPSRQRWWTIRSNESRAPCLDVRLGRGTWSSRWHGECGGARICAEHRVLVRPTHPGGERGQSRANSCRSGWGRRGGGVLHLLAAWT